MNCPKCGLTKCFGPTGLAMPQCTCSWDAKAAPSQEPEQKHPYRLDHDVFKQQMPNPSAVELASPMFNAIWDTCKSWDVNAPEYYVGYCGFNGSHAKLILDAIKAAPSQEPVAWRWPIAGTKAYDYQSHDFAVLTHMPCGEPLYTTPPDAAAQIAELKDESQSFAQTMLDHADEIDRMKEEILNRSLTNRNLTSLITKRDEKIDKLEFALENCRLLAARKRKEDWALLILGFCAEGGVVGSVTR